jgi:hypothetical protein
LWTTNAELITRTSPFSAPGLLAARWRYEPVLKIGERAFDFLAAHPTVRTRPVPEID